MFKNFGYNVLLHLKNIPSPSSNGRKIVVFECDDYGGIRMPSKLVYDKLKAQSVPFIDSRYNKYDTLETQADLEMLFEVLYSVKDKYGKPAVFTPFVNVANPDFEKIKNSGYESYFYEPFIKTYVRYYNSNSIWKLWEAGIEHKIFEPEFHGREHLAVQSWMKNLKSGNPDFLSGFEHGFVCIGPIPGLPYQAKELRPEFYFSDSSQMPLLHKSIIDGVRIFKDIFGREPFAFTPSNGIFHPSLESTLFDENVAFLNVSHQYQYSNGTGGIDSKIYSKKLKIKKNRLNYYVRNCAFEPIGQENSAVDLTLRQISAAFKMNRAAIISSHRINFSGGIDPQNRAKGLKDLRNLLHQIVRLWPNVEFLPTRKFLNELTNKGQL